MFRYDPAGFDGLPRSKFLEALWRRGNPLLGRLQPLYREPFLKNTLESRPFRAIYSPKRIAEYLERIHCPANDRLCEQGVWLTQTLLLGPRSDMDQIAEAVRKIQKQAGKLVKA